MYGSQLARAAHSFRGGGQGGPMGSEALRSEEISERRRRHVIEIGLRNTTGKVFSWKLDGKTKKQSSLETVLLPEKVRNSKLLLW